MNSYVEDLKACTTAVERYIPISNIGLNPVEHIQCSFVDF